MSLSQFFYIRLEVFPSGFVDLPHGLLVAYAQAVRKARAPPGKPPVVNGNAVHGETKWQQAALRTDATGPPALLSDMPFRDWTILCCTTTRRPQLCGLESPTTATLPKGRH